MHINNQKRIQTFAFFIALFLGVSLSIYLAVSARSNQGLSDDVFLEGRVNPNIASVESLERLPGVGRGKADAIVRYRDSFEGEIVFKSCDDLEKVNGIGVKTAENICAYLKFN